MYLEERWCQAPQSGGSRHGGWVLWFGEYKGLKVNLTLVTGEDEIDSTDANWASLLES